MIERQGQGLSTARKEKGFGWLFWHALQVSKAAKNSPYWHFDINAGRGWNEQADCPGSPLVFLEEVEKTGRLDVRTFFCDLDPEALAVLRGHTTPYLSRLPELCIEAHSGDNASFVDAIPSIIAEEPGRPSFAVGTLVCDPNGRHGLPLENLSRFFASFPRIDCILNLNLSLFARVEGCKGSENESISKGFLDWPEVRDIIRQMNKKYWLVRNPNPGGKGERFTIVYGHNHDKRGVKPFRDFFPIDSPNGRDVILNFKRINPTARNLPGMDG